MYDATARQRREEEYDVKDPITTSNGWRLPAFNSESKLLKPFYPATRIAMTPEAVADIAEKFGVPLAAVEAMNRDEDQYPLYKNGEEPEDYQVAIRYDRTAKMIREPGRMMFPRAMPPVIHLSIKRVDREPVTDWRHKQEIKNMVVGPEFEGIELFPAESRCVDTANQYHLWVFGDQNAIRDLGFPVGKKLAEGAADARQRGFGA
jgi:hypothetical protein